MKVFGIGLPKTGTTTLKHALKELGLTPGGALKFNDKDAEIFVGDYMCLPPNRYKTLDAQYPDAKFILTLRKNPDVWYDSVQRWAHKFQGHEGLRRQRRSMYGSEMPVRELFIPQYIDHADECFDYFQYKYGAKLSEKFIALCWEGGDGWDELCEFVNKPIPYKDFPHKNRNKI